MINSWLITKSVPTFFATCKEHRVENDNGEDFFFIADIFSPMNVRISGWDEYLIPPIRKCFLLVI